MTARQRVLVGYGGTCAWCLSSTRALEIDHVAGGQGQGTRHRATLTKRLEYVLCDAYDQTGTWPAGYQLLCIRCHDAKSHRRPTLMPARQGNTSINVSLPTELVERLDALASKPGVTRSQVVAEAIRSLLEGSASQTLLEGLHARLDSHAAALAALPALRQDIHALALSQQELQQRLETVSDRVERWAGSTPLPRVTAGKPGVIPYTPPQTEARNPARSGDGVTPWRWLIRQLRGTVGAAE